MSQPIRRALAGAFVALIALASAAPAVAQGANQNLKIAILDTEQILTSSATGKQAIEELRALQQEKSTEGEQRQQELQELRDRLTEGRLSLSEERITEMEKELEDKAIALRRFQDDANRELQKKREEVLSQIDRKVMPIINEYGEEQGFDLIFRKFESGLIYADEGVDITPAIIERLDAAEGGDSGSGS